MIEKKFIEIYDNFLPKALEDSYEKDIISQSYPFIYSPNLTSLESNNKYSPAFSVAFLERPLNPFYPKSNPHYFNQILYYLGIKLKINIIDIYRTRPYIQIPTINTTPNEIHIDNPYPHLSCVYYINDSDGDTIFFDDEENEIRRISPKKGKCVFFNGSIKHCSSPPSKTHRGIVNFNFLAENL